MLSVVISAFAGCEGSSKKRTVPTVRFQVFYLTLSARSAAMSPTVFILGRVAFDIFTLNFSSIATAMFIRSKDEAPRSKRRFDSYVISSGSISTYSQIISLRISIISCILYFLHYFTDCFIGIHNTVDNCTYHTVVEGINVTVLCDKGTMQI